MSDRKTFLLTSLTLGAIAAISAAVIGLSNLATKDRIAQNEIDKINSGLRAIYGVNDLKSVSKSISEAGLTETYKYVQVIYEVSDLSDVKLGYAFKTSGSNDYGKITLIVGFDETSHAFKKMSLVTNEQTYASTLVDKYFDPVNDGTRPYEDVTCGATYGAKLIRDMINEADKAAKELWK